MTIYAVKELFFTLQGEGAQAGRPAVFLRFAGCNLWSGLERDREHAVCQFCDTDFVGVDGQRGGKFETPQALARAVSALWPSHNDDSNHKDDHDIDEARRFVVCTGGEPLLQLDDALINALHEAGFDIAVESNGTIAAPAGIDWLCISPKAGAPLVQHAGDELKLVYPQKDAPPEAFKDLLFARFYLQPMDGPDLVRHTAAAIEYCKANPKWRLSLQTHKILGIE